MGQYETIQQYWKYANETRNIGLEPMTFKQYTDYIAQCKVYADLEATMLKELVSQITRQTS